ncbi:MAG: bifunctional folylpolyglutamate synthase/dihydrofolate synthase [Clostridiales bacterium]|nr:bifunctional folylpolyglutamate synthase/dihydrofolate synthase [Clostridiales bacterium]
MSDSKVPQFIKDSEKFGINLGLDRMYELDWLLENPEKDLKVVHVAGTNGKGSTVTYIASCLAASGLKVGIYTSPFLERFSERMRIIDGHDGLERLSLDETEGEIPEAKLEEYVSKVKEATEIMLTNGFEHPTEFELMTAVCYLWFRDEKVDVAVLETGLGGRLDSTNVIEAPLATVITSIGLDHQDRLGDTIEQIASEKAGIFKQGVPAFVADPEHMLLDKTSRDKVRQTIIDEATSHKVSSLTFVPAQEEIARFTDDGRMIFAIGEEEYETSLQGRHQVLNATLAVKVLKEVFGLKYEVIQDGIALARWKGRAELLRLEPAVILDGGHNVQCAESLVSTLKDMCNGRFKDMRFRVVIGVMADKNVEGMLRAYKEAGLDPCEVYAVKVNNPRTMDPESLSKMISFVYNNLIMPLSFDSALEGVSEACRRTREDGIPLLVTGSLYLIGEVRGKLCTITDNWR